LTNLHKIASMKEGLENVSEVMSAGLRLLEEEESNCIEEVDSRRN